MNRSIYTLRQAWTYRRALRSAMKESRLNKKNITKWRAEDFRAMKLKVLIFDFDGVLAAHGEPGIRLEVIQWLKKLILDWPEGKLYLWTNKPFLKRFDLLDQSFPEIKILKGYQKKPYPDALLSVIQDEGVLSEEVALIDDRLLTGILATAQTRSIGLYVTKPYSCYWRRPVAECFFGALRIIEYGLVGVLGRV